MSDTTMPLPPHPGLPAPGSGRHPANVGHLVMGVAFLGLTVVWALVASDIVQGSHIRWLMPIPWVSAGLAGLLVTVRTNRHRRSQYQSGWVTGTTTVTTTGSESTAEESR